MLCQCTVYKLTFMCAVMFLFALVWSGIFDAFVQCSISVCTCVKQYSVCMYTVHMVFVSMSIMWCFSCFCTVWLWYFCVHLCEVVFLCTHVYCDIYHTLLQCGISVRTYWNGIYVCTCTKWHFWVLLCKVVKFAISKCTKLYFCVHVYMCRKLALESPSTLFGNSLVIMRWFLWQRLSLKAGKNSCQVPVFHGCVWLAKMTSVRFSQKLIFHLISVSLN